MKDLYVCLVEKANGKQSFPKGGRKESKDETIYEYIKNEIARISDKISYVDRQMVNHIVKMHNK